MTIDCGTITVHKPPAHIEATNMTIDPMDCDEPCGATVTITWTNNGGVTQTITPAIIVDTVSTPATESITLGPGESAIVEFDVTGLMEGDHSVCPDPN